MFGGDPLGLGWDTTELLGSSCAAAASVAEVDKGNWTLKSPSGGPGFDSDGDVEDVELVEEPGLAWFSLGLIDDLNDDSTTDGLLVAWLLLEESMLDSILWQVCSNMDRGLDFGSYCKRRIEKGG